MQLESKMIGIRELLSAKLTSTRAASLKNQTFSDRSPGPLLTDIACLIDVIGDGVSTTSDYFALPQRLLAELNESLVDPLPNDLKRPQLRSFPTIMGLFMILRSTGMAIGETKPKRAVLIDPAVKEQWLLLNSTERYFSLMASWLYETTWDCVGTQGRWKVGMLSEVRDTYLRLPDRTTVLGSDRYGMQYGVEASVALSLMHQFGWIRMGHEAKSQPGKAANVREIQRTDFGDAMFIVSCQFESPEGETPAALHAKLQKYFPDWKAMLIQPPTEFRKGLHVFKVAIGQIWRRIIAPASVNLEQLADTILAAYQFDKEHLYQFELRNKKGSTIEIVGPYMDDADFFAEEMRIGDVPLLVGDSMVFHYDFGDDWRFKVTLESVDETSATKVTTPQVTETSGKALIQYDRSDW